jgi:Ca2+-transporting ATPase
MKKFMNFKNEYKGLDSEKAAENLSFYGYNSEKKRRELEPDGLSSGGSGKLRLYGVFKSLRLYLMIAAVFIYFADGSPNNAVKGGLLLFLAFGTAFFEIVLENYCGKKLRSVTAASSVIVRVVRDSEIRLVRREEVVQDDLIILQGGEIVPADAHILESTDVTVDESLFTGEHGANPTAAKKHSGRSNGKQELKSSCVYKGTKVLTGVLIARVSDIGQDVKIRPVNRPKDSHHTELESFIGKISTFCAYMAAIVLVVTAVIRLIAASGAQAEEGVSVLTYLAAIILPAFSFALCAIPVPLGLIARLHYVNAAASLSQKYGDVRRLKVVETLNSVTAVCVEKDVIVDAGSTPIAGESGSNLNMLARIASLSCSKSPASSYERAISISAAFKHIDVKDLYENTLVKAYPPKLGDYSNIHGNLWEIGGARLLCVKGTPEKVLSFCKLPPEQLYPIQEKHSQYAKEGHHVFAVAFAQINKQEDDGSLAVIPKSLFDVEYTYLGMLAFASTINDGISEAVQSCYRAGIKVIMLTRDSKESALAIAQKAGIYEDGVVEGEKTAIIKKLRAGGEITAVFGHDNSDVESVEIADLSIAASKHTTDRKWDLGSDTMSDSTTGSTCQICDFIVGKDAFIKTAQAFSDARKTHRNIKRCISAAISAFLAVFLFGLVSLIAVGSNGMNYTLEAVFVSTVMILTTIGLTFFFMNNDADSYSLLRPSDFLGKNTFNRTYILGALIQGISLFAAASIMFVAFRFSENTTAGMLRSIFLSVFMSGCLSMMWVNLSYEEPFYKSLAHKPSPLSDWRSNPAIFMTAGLLLFIIVAIYTPFAGAAFGLARINVGVLLMSILLGAISQLWFDFIKKRFYN